MQSKIWIASSTNFSLLGRLRLHLSNRFQSRRARSHFRAGVAHSLRERRIERSRRLEKSVVHALSVKWEGRGSLDTDRNSVLRTYQVIDRSSVPDDVRAS